jgi:hypothetical protein
MATQNNLIVFVNIMINALESMGVGGRLESLTTKARNTTASLFSMTAPASRQNPLERLFEPFVTGKENGTGLGLAISRRIIQEHEGTLLAANGPAGGALLTVDLPVASDSPDPNRTGDRPHAPFTRASTDPKGFTESVMAKLLVVDDEPAILFSLERAFCPGPDRGPHRAFRGGRAALGRG